MIPPEQPPPVPDALREKAERIRLLVLDVDGVLTDGSLWYTGRGEVVKPFHVRDGLGLKIWQAAGGRVAVLSGRKSGAVTRRAEELGLHPVLQGYDNKVVGWHELLNETGFAPEQVAGIGDDLPDLPFLARCGLALTVSDAAAEVRAMAHHVTAASGGRGAVREAIEWLFKTRGQWNKVVDSYRVSG